MGESRLAAIVRQRCPRCLRGRVFRPGNWLQLKMYQACPDCRVIYGRESGYFTGAMIVSYILGVPLLAALALITWWISGWRAEIVIAIGGLYFLAFVPAIFRYSRVIWMHFDRVVDPDPTSERYAPPLTPRSPRS
jgi:uncharacterized protein (DUF983 family)